MVVLRWVGKVVALQVDQRVVNWEVESWALVWVGAGGVECQQV